MPKEYGAVDQAGLGDEEGHLLVAERCGSYTHMALAAGKSMGNMMAIGQAAGVTAALANREGIFLRVLPYEQVKEGLRRLEVTEAG